jgi:hypothetical protein
VALGVIMIGLSVFVASDGAWYFLGGAWVILGIGHGVAARHWYNLQKQVSRDGGDRS